MRTFKRIQNRGFTLVELMIVVAIIGILAALAIYGVRKYMMNAKTAEAKEGIGRMAKDASAAFNREWMGGTTMGLGTTRGISHRLCLGTDAPVPAAPPVAQKYQSSPKEWDTGSYSAGWQCLKFSMQDPQYYSYNYTATAALGSFAAIANGDLDGDGTTSQFTLNGAVKSASGSEKVVVVAPNFEEAAPEE